MKTINVSPRSRTLNKLLKEAKNGDLMLKAPNGEFFVLTPLEVWVGFDVGSSRSFAEEARRTVANKKLMRFLARRRTPGKPIPLAEVKKQLGLTK